METILNSYSYHIERNSGYTRWDGPFLRIIANLK